MRVLHLFNEIQFSGAEIMYATAAPLFQINQVDQIAFSTGKDIGNFAPYFEKANIKIYHKPIDGNFFSLHSLQYYRNFYSFIKEKKIEVLHIHRSNLNFVAVIAWFAGIKCIKTQHNTFKNRWFTLPYAIILRFLLRKIFQVRFQTIGQSVYNNELNYYKNPSIKINNWYDDSKFYPKINEEEKIEIRKELGINENSFVIISTGSCSRIKNHFDIIKSLVIVNKEFPCVFLHLGHGDTEEEEKTIAKQLGVSECINFLGNQSDVRKFLIASDVFVMTSIFEGLSIASIEAMACKLPSILYDSPGLRDMINNNDNGFLIKSDYKVLAERIIFAKMNPLIMEDKANKAYQHVITEYSLKLNVNKILTLYRSLEVDV